MGDISYPNESLEYRNARNKLLQAEIKLREHIEEVARQGRTLPPGGVLKENYVFDERINGKEVRIKFSDLFSKGKDTLLLYSFMYSPDMEAACPMCTSFLDGLDAQVVHIREHIDIAVVAKHSLSAIHDHAHIRSWSHLRLLSSARNTYNTDYFGEVDGRQITNANVFVRGKDGIRHFWGTELTMGPWIEGGNMRHLDLVWPLWNILDMTPAGRGNWYPKLDYGSK
ncbi:MAG: DUF899 domain-containing protein [Deltaproteobacteria bacterium]|nr:DUF899 domain-containing protein [Deltaproteobacteria bacterium]